MDFKSNTLLDRSYQWIDPLCEGSEETMDRDRALFLSVKQGMLSPILRFYHWERPTLSYGRTQKLDFAAASQIKGSGWPVVMRPTGGGKVFHQDDTCFSLIWSKFDSPIPWAIRDSYCQIHGWIRESLKLLNVLTSRHDPKTQSESSSDLDPSVCFQSPVQDDLMHSGAKLVGGAQWRDHNFALHQGSIQRKLTLQEIKIFKQKFEEIFQIK